MLRAKRNPEKKIVDAYVKDMQESCAKKEWEDQVEEFGKYLIEKYRQAPAGGNFFSSMHEKLEKGTVLTENMVNALRKCMKQDVERAEQAKKIEAGDLSGLPTKTFKVKQWWMKQNKLDSRIVTGVVMKETAKAYLVKGHADMLENLCFCVRCGRELTEPASQITGMGAICAGKAGVPYDPADVLSASPAKRKKIRESFLVKLHDQQFEAWLPKSQVEEELEAPKAEPKKAKAKKTSAKKATKKSAK